MKKLINFIFEAYQLKRMPRSGSQLLGANLGSIAEHTFLVSLIGLVLAIKERAHIEKVLLMCLIHDLPETRIGDANYINKRYQTLLENQALKDQTIKLGKSFYIVIKNIFEEYSNQNSLESKLTKDADILEQLFCEKVAYETGNKQARQWIKHSKGQLKSKTAKKIGTQLMSTNSHDWWQDLHNKAIITTMNVIQKNMNFAS